MCYFICIIPTNIRDKRLLAEFAHYMEFAARALCCSIIFCRVKLRINFQILFNAKLVIRLLTKWPFWIK